MISIRTKKNIALTLTVLGAIMLIGLVLQALLDTEAMGWRELFRIFGAAVITACMFNIFRKFARRNNQRILR